MNHIEMLWVTTDRTLGLELIKQSKEGTIKQGAQSDKLDHDTFEIMWKAMLDVIPAALEIPDNINKKFSKKYKFDTFNRADLEQESVGIKIEY